MAWLVNHHLDMTSQSESPHLVVTNHKLHGHNFLQWSQPIFMYICGRGKDGHFTGEIMASEAKDSQVQILEG